MREVPKAMACCLVELDHHIQVGVRPRFSSSGGTEEGELDYAPPLAELSELLS
jgi:hypothetical protein